VALVEIAPGLGRWTGWDEDWKEDVGGVAVDTADGLVLIDPPEPTRRVERIDQDETVSGVHRDAADVLLPVLVPRRPAAQPRRDLDEGHRQSAGRPTSGSSSNRSCPNSTGSAFSACTPRTTPSTSAFTSFISFIASRMQRV